MNLDNCFFYNLTISQLLMAVLCFSYFPPSLYGQKINGMSLSSPEHPPFQLATFENLQTINANWVALIPEATLDRITLQLLPDSQNHWWGETEEANIQAIQLAKQVGLKVFLKPHIVLGKIPDRDQATTLVRPMGRAVSRRKIDKTKGAKWRGTLKVRSEKDWQLLETNYETYILRLAQIAADLDVELFAVGTELGNFTAKRPDFWRQLIQKIRTIYTGALVYCANWDEYDKISFWSALDFIGVDTYFPINKMKTPSIKRTLRNWRPIRKQLKRLSKQTNKQILLTEFGYRNVPYAGKRPWTHDKGVAIVNNEAQQNLYHAFFQTFWKKNWIAGGFAWTWFAEPEKERPTSFSVQGKPAVAELRYWFSQ